MVINYICRASKAGKDGLSPIEVSVIINGIRRYFCLDRRVKASSFNTKTQRVRQDPETNEYLNVLRVRLYSLETEMINAGLEITVDTFIDVYKHGIKSNTTTLLQMFEIHHKMFRERVAKGVNESTTLSKYETTARYVKDYLKSIKKSDIMLKDITPRFVEEFFVYLLSYMSNNTAIWKMKQLKKILRLAVEEGYIKVSPFKFVLKAEKKEMVALTIEEVQRIENKEITNERLNRVRDLFVFACHTGLSFTDLTSITKEDI
ncbi:MAG: site-specific integrase, partial [Bacteroidales bacterium]|nr:site-specific integrase [Bacteroidales bacterium]